MNKKFFYYAFAVMTAMCLTACSSDDDNDNGGNQENKVNLPTPPNAQNATQFKLVTPQAPNTTDKDAPALTTIDITESNDVMLELRHPESKNIVYVKGKAIPMGNNKYGINGEMVSGSIELIAKAARATRAGGSEIILDIEVKFSAVEVYTYKTPDGETATAEKITPITGDDAVDRLARTWNITGLILDLKSSDVKAFEEWDAVNGILDLETTILKTANERNCNLTADEQNELKKKVKSVTITKTGIFSLDYVGLTSDAASWQWTDTSKKSFRITLKDGKMGNKFIQNASLVTADFNGDRCNLKLVTTFTDNSNKKWDAIVTLKLKS